jgi:hypothetical protein
MDRQKRSPDKPLKPTNRPTRALPQRKQTRKEKKSDNSHIQTYPHHDSKRKLNKYGKRKSPTSPTRTNRRGMMDGKREKRKA